MKTKIDALLKDYESGAIGRDGFIDAVHALAEGAAEPSAPAQYPMKALNINHVTMCVSDIRKTHSFYQKLLDVPVVGESDFEIDLGIGNSFLAIMKTKRPIGIDHFCIGVPDYDPEKVADFVASRGLEPRVFTETQGVKFKQAQVYVPDPDGIMVQFSRPDYSGEMPAPRKS